MIKVLIWRLQRNTLNLKKILFLLIIGFHFVAIAQHDLYVGAEADFGIVGKPSFDNNTLAKKNLSPHIGGTIFVNFRLFDLMSLEAGIGQHWNNTRLKDPAFEKQNSGFSVELNSKNYYWNYYGAVSSMLRLGLSKTYLYGKLAYSINVYGDQNVGKEKSFVISRLGVDQTLDYQASYVKSNQSLIPEIGVQHKLTNRHLISMGLKMNIGSSDALTGSYTITDNISGTNTRDQFSALGNHTSLTFRYSFSLHHIPKKEKVTRIVEKVKKKPIEVKNDTVEVIKPKPPRKAPREIADRKLIVTRKIKVHSSRVTVFIWDHQTVDGDRVSLNFNEKWILKNYTLKKEKHSFEIDLEEGINTFVLHALNLGKYEPNTAALIVKDGVKSHKIILESDLNESGTLEINYKKKEK